MNKEEANKQREKYYISCEIDADTYNHIKDYRSLEKHYEEECFVELGKKYAEKYAIKKVMYTYINVLTGTVIHYEERNKDNIDSRFWKFHSKKFIYEL